MPIATDVAERLARETAGNPLALLESARALTADQLAGREHLVGPMPIGRSAERLFNPRIDALSLSARRALLVAAAADESDLGPILAAAREIGGDAPGLEEAEAAGLITVENARLSFTHPLVRSAVYAAAPPAERRSAHRGLANKHLRGRVELLRGRTDAAQSILAAAANVIEAHDRSRAATLLSEAAFAAMIGGDGAGAYHRPAGARGAGDGRWAAHGHHWAGPRHRPLSHWPAARRPEAGCRRCRSRCGRHRRQHRARVRYPRRTRAVMGRGVPAGASASRWHPVGSSRRWGARRPSLGSLCRRRSRYSHRELVGCSRGCLRSRQHC
jgi:hypothetical protein